MRKYSKSTLMPFLVLVFLICLGRPVLAQDATEIVRGAYEYMRGRTSRATLEMIIKRPDWSRSVTLLSWTEGTENSIFWVTEPAKDRGNGTLKKGRQMWTFNPKINRTIKVPPSMMSQAWMGSDFSNNDLARSDSLLVDYHHELEQTSEHDGQKVYHIKAIPKEDAPVVWGMLRMRIRADHLLLYEGFFDEDLELVKVMETFEIADVGGRKFPKRWRMAKADEADSFTELVYHDLAFDLELPGQLFQLKSLKSPKE